MITPYTGSYAAHDKPARDEISDETLVEFMDEDIRSRSNSLTLRPDGNGKIAVYHNEVRKSCGDTVREALTQYLLSA